MTDNLKIGIVEDDFLIAESIYVTLVQIGYQPLKPVRNYVDALNMIDTQHPDLLILDITLEGEQDGIDLALKIKQEFTIPFIFLTAYSDKATVNRAKAARPYAYLVKPFNENDLFSAIEIAFNNYNRETPDEVQKPEEQTHLKNAIFIKEGHLFHRVNMQDIHYVESDNVYLNIYSSARKYVVRDKLDDFISQFSRHDFLRIHRSFAINMNHLEVINELYVVVAGVEVPIQKPYRKALLDSVNATK